MFKRTLIFALLAFLMLAPVTAAQGSSEPLLLAARQLGYGLKHETTVTSVNLTTGVVKDIFTLDSPYTGFSISPAGDQLAYYIIPVGKGDPQYHPTDMVYYLQSMAGGKPRRLAIHGYKARDNTRGFAPIWSPDGTRVAVVVRESPSSATTIQIINAATTETEQILHADPPPTYYPPLWSPDGKSLAYEAEYCGRCVRGTVYIASTNHPDAAQPVLPQKASPTTENSLIGWLPDSQEVLITDDVTPLLEHPANATSRWLRVNVETGAIQTIPLTSVPKHCTEVVLMNPTTARIIEEVGGGAFMRNVDLATNGEHFPTQVGENYSSCDAILSPDQTRIILSDGGIGFWVLNIQTGEQIAHLSFTDRLYPVLWTPDGEGLVFQLYLASSHTMQILTQKANGHGEMQIAADIKPSQILGWVQ